MLTFLEFYQTLLQFVNFKLYHSLSVPHPPVLDSKLEEAAAGLAAIMQDIAQHQPHKAPNQVPAGPANRSPGLVTADLQMLPAALLQGLESSHAVEGAASDQAAAARAGDEEDNDEDVGEIDSGDEDEDAGVAEGLARAGVAQGMPFLRSDVGSCCQVPAGFQPHTTGTFVKALQSYTVACLGAG